MRHMTMKRLQVGRVGISAALYLLLQNESNYIHVNRHNLDTSELTNSVQNSAEFYIFE